MPPRRRGSSGYVGVRAGPADNFYAEIRTDDRRIGLGTFETAHEAARAYDAAAWRLSPPRQSMNFDDVATTEQVHQIAPPPCLITEEEQRCHRVDRSHRRDDRRRLLITEEDERLRREWVRRFPDNVRAMGAFEEERAQRKFDRRQSRLETRYDKAKARLHPRVGGESHDSSRRPAMERSVGVGAGVLL
jgi:hypothetical protein